MQSAVHKAVVSAGTARGSVWCGYVRCRATISFVMSVRLSAGRIFMKFDT